RQPHGTAAVAESKGPLPVVAGDQGLRVPLGPVFQRRIAGLGDRALDDGQDASIGCLNPVEAPTGAADVDGGQGIAAGCAASHGGQGSEIGRQVQNHGKPPGKRERGQTPPAGGQRCGPAVPAAALTSPKGWGDGKNGSDDLIATNIVSKRACRVKRTAIRRPKKPAGFLGCRRGWQTTAQQKAPTPLGTAPGLRGGLPG